VDDGSTDGTWEIIQTATDSVPWIKAKKRPPKGYVGLSHGEPLAAIYDGYNLIRSVEFEYLAKLDGDVTLDPSYFELLLRECERDPGLGMVSGSCWELTRWNHRLQRSINGSSWPPARFYRRRCFEEISGVPPVLGWDMLQVLRATIMGWKVGLLRVPRFFHGRKMGSRAGILKGEARYGRTSYLLGYSFWYFVIRLLFELAKYPYVVGSVAMLYGYVAALVGRDMPIVNDEERELLRRMQKDRLVGIATRTRIDRQYP